MNDTRLKAALDGEKAIAAVVLKVLPLIAKHFEDFTGKRAILQSGGKASKFKKLVNAFEDKAREIAGEPTLRVYIESSRYSMSVNLDIRRPVPNSDYGCEYFKQYLYFGSLDNDGTFRFNCDVDDYRNYARSIIACTPAKIRKAKKTIAELESAIEAARDSIPNAYRDLIK